MIHFFSFPTKSRTATPNLRDSLNNYIHLKVYTPQSVISGNWSSDSTWSQNSFSPIYSTASVFAYILNGTTVSVDSINFYYHHVLIEPGT